MAEPTFNCAVCNKPVDLRTAKTNAFDKAVHERCYALEQALIRAAWATKPTSCRRIRTLL